MAGWRLRFWGALFLRRNRYLQTSDRLRISKVWWRRRSSKVRMRPTLLRSAGANAPSGLEGVGGDIEKSFEKTTFRLDFRRGGGVWVHDL